jgi:hypothetical protein
MLIKDKFHIESRMPVQLKGKTDKVTPYCILGALQNAEPEDLGVVTDVVS